MALVVLDASVVIAFLDPDDALHPAAVAALTEHQHDDLVVPASVYAEVLVGPYRSGTDAVDGLDAFLSDFGVTVEPITKAVARTAARLRSASKSLRLPDALVLGAAAEIRADRVLTGDRSWAGIDPTVSVVRPA